MEIRALGVVGGGQMGHGIAHVAAAAGLPSSSSTSSRAARKARAAIEKNLEREVAKGKLTTEEQRPRSRALCDDGDLEALAAADLVVEAVVENEAVKKEVFGDSTAICPARRRSSPSNTSARSRSPAWPRRPAGPSGSSACTS